MPVTVAGDGHWVDRIDLAAGGPKAGDQESPGGLDRDRDGIVRAVAVLGEQMQQVLEAGRIVADHDSAEQSAPEATTATS
ncbi:hypothetical protein QF032_007920 [Streptomyces achromogenes]|nr:hypothetical protein [Streptomyces achromogenes]